MEVNDLIADSMRNPATPDLQEFVFVFYCNVNAELWEFLSKELCSKICLVKWNEENRRLYNELFCWDEKNFDKPFKLRITIINNGAKFYLEFEDEEPKTPKRFYNGCTIDTFIDVFVKDLNYPSKLW